MPSVDGRERVAFDALEYCADDTFARVHLQYRRGPAGRWLVERQGRPHLDLAPGYRLVRARACGVCSTDLDRRFLPFALPQVIGHEVVVEDDTGRRFVAEINASDHALGESPPCAFCRAGLESHCPDRLVLGIHDLPGGFGPWLLVPRHALVEVPHTIPDTTAALIEPFAAALHAVSTIAPEPGSTIAVLGPRRLGLLVVAALAAHRRATAAAFEILALTRRSDLGTLAVELGADHAECPDSDPFSARPVADVVIDTTGAPDGLALACALARREVHLKSTHGRPALGCAHLTEAVVDEIAFAGTPHGDDGALVAALRDVAPLCEAGALRVGWLCANEPPATLRASANVVRASDPGALLERLESGDDGPSAHTLPRVDALVIDDRVSIDSALRPRRGEESSPIRPRGLCVVRNSRAPSPGLEDAPLRSVLAGGLRISTSRCGDFRAAVAMISSDASLCGLGPTLVTHHFGPEELADAFSTARSADAIKVLVEHPARSPQARLHDGGCVTHPQAEVG